MRSQVVRMQHRTYVAHDAGHRLDEAIDGLVGHAEGELDAHVALRERAHGDEHVAGAAQIRHA